MDFNTWLDKNGVAIKNGWDEWCYYYARYRQHFAADYRIPVPQFYLDAMMNKDPQRGPKTLAYFKQCYDAGQPVQIPPPVPGPPASTFAGRAMQHGHASQTTGEAMWRGAKEGFKSQAPKAAATLLGMLFRRR